MHKYFIFRTSTVVLKLFTESTILNKMKIQSTKISNFPENFPKYEYINFQIWFPKYKFKNSKYIK